MIELVKVSEKDNLPIFWTEDRFNIVKESYPNARITYSKTIMINEGKNKVKWLDPFLVDEIKFIPFQGFCKYLKWKYDYDKQELVSQLVYGDRNLRPYDADTGDPCGFMNLNCGYFNHSSIASHNRDTQRSRSKDPIERAKMRINFAYNRVIKIANYNENMYFYLAKLNNSDDIKFGVTSYKDLSRRKNFGYGIHDGSNYSEAIILAEGNSELICRLERDYKLLNLNTTERITKSELNNLLNFVTNYDKSLTIFNIEEFICR